ncbi:hypothetical protein [Paracoccus mutanolyticus]|uniref:hypothetical protein n=1 Tax=Paracoccus mutanolyticus TaxID=1499308 RepID=UPI001CB9D21E|nr:hypothetical protein [Paracoccus mutanolyticus]
MARTKPFPTRRETSSGWPTPGSGRGRQASPLVPMQYAWHVADIVGRATLRRLGAMLRG